MRPRHKAVSTLGRGRQTGESEPVDKKPGHGSVMAFKSRGSRGRRILGALGSQAHRYNELETSE